MLLMIRHGSRNRLARAAFLGEPANATGPNLTASDTRFITKGDVLYAVAMGRPDGGKIGIKALASNSAHHPGGIGRVQLLGSSAKLEFSRDETGLAVTIPDSAASDYATALKITKA
jgi:alpha-L-fucosidase